MSPTRWAEIQVRVSPEAAEGVSDQMQTWASGVAETTSNGLVTLTCYLPADDHLGTRADAITQRLHALRALGLEVNRSRKISACQITVTGEDGRLVATCQAMAYRKKDRLPFL